MAAEAALQQTEQNNGPIFCVIIIARKVALIGQIGDRG